MEDNAKQSSSSTSTPSQPPPPLPPRIQPLPKTVIDRIAAGEVVQRPASIVKEFIENSLDAQSTSIDVHIANGGLSNIILTDDGIGFHKDDLRLAATRFATSKLKSFEDLNSIRTFGFRGEALASASMVGRLTIISKKRKQPNGGSGRSSSCAFKMSYTEGKPNGKPQPSAGKEGTMVKVEDLFYNLPSRRRAFEGTKKENEEYFKILKVVQQYAVHCAGDGVGFVCRKRGGVTDLNTTSLSSSLKQVKQYRKTLLQVLMPMLMLMPMLRLKSLLVRMIRKRVTVQLRERNYQ